MVLTAALALKPLRRMHLGRGDHAVVAAAIAATALTMAFLNGLRTQPRALTDGASRSNRDGSGPRDGKQMCR